LDVDNLNFHILSFDIKKRAYIVQGERLYGEIPGKLLE
jgi:hypothetical protein